MKKEITIVKELSCAFDNKLNGDNIFESKLKSFEEINIEKDKYLNEINQIKLEKEELHEKINLSVKTISKEKNEWDKNHEKLIQDNKLLVKNNDVLENNILILKDEIYTLKNKLNET